MALGRRPVLLVDATPVLVWYLSIAEYMPRMTTSGLACGGITGTLLTLRKMCERWNPQRIVLVYDAWGSTRRHRLLPAYKAARREREVDDTQRQWIREQTRAQAAYICESDLMRVAGVQTMCVDGHEADDVIALLARHVTDEPCVVVAEDKDLLQLVGPNVSVYRPRRTDTVDLATFYDVTSRMTPFDHLLSLSVLGDRSDGIPGVPGVGDVTVNDLFTHRSYPTAEALRAYCAQYTGQNEKRVREIAHGWSVVERNLDLIDLGRDVFTPEETARAIACLTAPIQHREVATHSAASPFLQQEARSMSSVLVPLSCLARR